ncbi:hypothetical protein E2C01_099836 [Portunus trituberculatus]|uniref:Uncharacterized protein n=1 Tax=Portunus trituberculatus TaxID=210409 RepID=A0A5B7K6J4_PORTR|nr:hypothetical protein [Portunus trituberculatus]
MGTPTPPPAAWLPSIRTHRYELLVFARMMLPAKHLQECTPLAGQQSPAVAHPGGDWDLLHPCTLLNLRPCTHGVHMDGITTTQHTKDRHPGSADTDY